MTFDEAKKIRWFRSHTLAPSDYANLGKTENYVTMLFKDQLRGCLEKSSFPGMRKRFFVFGFTYFFQTIANFDRTAYEGHSIRAMSVIPEVTIEPKSIKFFIPLIKLVYKLPWIDKDNFFEIFN